MLITSLYASLLGIYYIFISIFVVTRRFVTGVVLGDGTWEIVSQIPTMMKKTDDINEIQQLIKETKSKYSPLLKSIRIHSNFAEYVPMTLVLLGMLELNGVEKMYVHGVGCLLMLARLGHFIGIYFYKPVGTNVFRASSIGINLSLMMLLCLWNIYLVIA